MNERRSLRLAGSSDKSSETSPTRRASGRQHLAGGAGGTVLALSLCALFASAGLTACSSSEGGNAGNAGENVDAGAPPADGGTNGGARTRVEGKKGSLFDGELSSFATVDDATGAVTSVGVVVPLTSFTSAPKSHPYQDDVVLEMPDVAVEQTIVHHLRANWLPGGHSPTPYGEAHFDLHFMRGTIDEIDAIQCRANGTKPTADVLPEGYGQPEMCVDGSGDHAWPKADKAAGAKFSASLIMGYFGGKVVFIEPMITKSMLLKKETFEMAIPKPTSAGGASTLYPTRMTATWSDETESYTFEFDQLQPID